MQREHVWVRLGLSWFCATAFRAFLSFAAIRIVLEPYVEQSEKKKPKDEEEKKKICLQFRSDPTLSRKFLKKKNSKIIQKLKNIILALFLSKLGRDSPRKRGKILSGIPFLQDLGKKIP